MTIDDMIVYLAELFDSDLPLAERKQFTDEFYHYLLRQHRIVCEAQGIGSGSRLLTRTEVNEKIRESGEEFFMLLYIDKYSVE